jgi:N-acetylmuramoyl-L-alanine amidase
MLLKDYREQNTKGIAGLSRQLAAQAVQMGFLAELKHDNITTDPDSDVLLYLHPTAANKLYAVADRVEVVVSTAYRSLDKQYALKRNLTSLVANVGRSDHGSGKSLDITNYRNIQAVLESNGFTQSYPDRDPVHFDCDGIPDNRSNTILAFQKLHNSNNVKQITEDGDCGEGTLFALGYAPVGGYRNALSQRYMSNGDYGKDVGDVQFALDRLGLYKGSHDGSFGNGTERAVIAFQAANKLEETGIVDRFTLAAIQKADG